METQLIIPAITGQVHLGCLAEERLQTQAVTAAIRIDFSQIPTTCYSDNVKETPCYAEMSQSLQMVFAEKHYQTIEHLGLVCYQQLEKYLKKYSQLAGSTLTLTLNKVKPPVEQITKGCQFVIKGQIL